MALAIVADDLTGACDTGALFTGRGPLPVVVWPATPPPAAVQVIDTESRDAPVDQAAARVRRAATLTGAERYFKKIDSTLRGHVGPEVDALMRASGLGTALVCPAFPAVGRVVVDRVLYVDDVAVGDTALGRDADFPVRGSSSVVDVLRAGLDRPLAWIPLEHVRAGGDALAARIGRLAGTVIAADAERDADLDALVAAALGTEPPLLLVGAGGLARALASRLGLLAADAVLVPEGHWLLVAGSRHPATRAQVTAARAAGLSVIAAPEGLLSDHSAVALRLAAEARDRLARENFDGVAVTGGATAVALCAALGADGLDLLGVPRPGLSLGRLRSGRHAGLAVVTKAGSFGEPELFVSMLAPALARGART